MASWYSPSQQPCALFGQLKRLAIELGIEVEYAVRFGETSDEDAYRVRKDAFQGQPCFGIDPNSNLRIAFASLAEAVVDHLGLALPDLLRGAGFETIHGHF